MAFWPTGCGERALRCDAGRDGALHVTEDEVLGIALGAEGAATVCLCGTADDGIVLGEAVNVAQKLTVVATTRQMDHLLTSETLESPAGRLAAVEVEGVELGGKQIRLFRLE